MSGAFDQAGPARRRRCVRDDSGAAAVEFAIVAVPFLALVLAVLELALNYIFFSQVDFLTAKAHAGIRTGEVTLHNMDAAEFKQKHLCPNLTMLPCEPLTVNVLTIKNWWDSTGWNNLDLWRPEHLNPHAAKFCPGGAADVVVLQVAYPVPFMSVFWSGPRSAAGGVRYFLSTTTFRNDPFGLPENTRAEC